MNKIAARVLAPVLLALMSAAMAMPACATLQRELPVILSGVDNAMLVVDAIDEIGKMFLAAHPDPELASKLALAVARAKTAAAAARAAAAGAGSLEAGDAAAAFASFQAAYEALVSLGGSFGVRQGDVDKPGGAPGELVVPPFARVARTAR